MSADRQANGRQIAGCPSKLNSNSDWSANIMASSGPTMVGWALWRCSTLTFVDFSHQRIGCVPVDAKLRRQQRIKLIDFTYEIIQLGQLHWPRQTMRLTRASSAKQVRGEQGKD